MVKTYTPKSVKEALTIRQQDNTVLLAGGTDLMVRYRGGPGIMPEFTKPVVFIGHLAELQTIHRTDGRLIIGAAATLSTLLANEHVPEIIKQAVRQMASPAVRNTGTIGGNICNASPAGDTLPPLYALGASVILDSLAGRRELPIGTFIKGPGKTDIRQDEIVSAIHIPEAGYNVTFYKKVGTRKADALSKLSFAGVARISGQKVEKLGLAFGAVAPQVVRAEEAESLVIGKSALLPEAEFCQLRNKYASLIKPIDDQRSSARYRKTVALNLLEHFITECLFIK